MNTLTVTASSNQNRPLSRPSDALAMDEAARIRATLAKVSIFGGLTGEALDELAGRVTVRRTLGGQLIVPPGRSGDALHIIMGGRVKLVLFGDSGREVTLNVLRAGDIFGEGALFDAAARPAAAAVALDPTTVLVLSRHDLMALINETPEIALRMLGEMARRQRRADETIAELALCDVSERLIRRLIGLAREEAVEGAEALSLRRRPTQQDLANMVGSCRETVSRMFNQLARRGLIIPRGRGLDLTPALIRMVEPAKAA